MQHSRTSWVCILLTLSGGWQEGWPCMERGSTHSPLSTEEIEKKLNIYHKGAKIWKMLIFCQVEPEISMVGVVSPSSHCMCSRGGRVCASVGWVCACLIAAALATLRPDCDLLQGGPGHLYLLKNKVATFAKVEKEEDMIQ